MVLWQSDRRIVNRQSGPGTMTGEGDIVTDSYGTRWREVPYFVGERGTGERRAVIRPDGTIREI